MTQDEYHQFIERRVEGLRVSYAGILNRGERKGDCMERYTRLDGDGNYVIDGNELYEDQCENYCGPAADRLAAYEDTGFTPQEIKSLWGEWNANRSALEYARAELDAVTKRMIELEQKLAQMGG